MEKVDVAIVGSGFSGLGMAIRLKQEGNHDFVVIERDTEVGGTWHANTYPGCACDVPSHLYSFSFAPNPSWTQTYSRQPEIRDYLRRCADQFGIRPHVRLETNLEEAAWNEEEQRWHVRTDRGSFSARVLVSGMGPLTEPKIPDVPGVEDFQGEVMHSARWNHDYDFGGKRVASVGTGASAIQYVPAIQPEVEKLHVFQRTAPWIVPHSSRPTTRLERRLYAAFPAAQRLVRRGIYWTRESLVVGFVKRPRLMPLLEHVAKRHIAQAIKDPELRRKVTPDYTIGCKRILPSNKWYPALAADNAELVTGGLTEIRANSVVGADGVEREVDAIVFGTGFQVTEMPASRLLRGRDGRTLSEVWAGSPRAYRGTTAAGFPNLFLLLGPNTGLGHSSMVHMVESQIAYVLDALRTMRQRDAAAVEVRADAVEHYNRDLDERMEGTIWNAGCVSWYQDAEGRNGALWPDWTWRFREELASFDEAAYEIEAARPELPEAPAAPAAPAAPEAVPA